MSYKKLLLWEKYRPKTIEDIILLPRIRARFENGVNQHYIFHGHYGTGKTSLARILIGVYSKETPYLIVNCSEETSIEYLRDEITTFCKTKSMLDTNSDIKYVFLDEFEKVSKSFQLAFKGFVEKYNGNVIFILNTNHLDRIDGGMISRFKKLNFDCLNHEEEKFLKKEIFKRIKNVILEKENKDVPKENLINIINKKFPDFREIIVDVQDYMEVGDVDNLSSNVSNKLKLDLYNTIYNDKISYEDVYNFLMNNFGGEGISNMIKLLGKPFINWSIENNKNIDKLFECNYIIADYSDKLENSTDPIVLGMTIVGKLRGLLN